MIEAEHALPITRQTDLLELSRASVYYLPRTASASDVALMRRIDDLHLNHPFAGSRILRDLLGQEGYSVGRRHVATLMKTMGIEALYRCPNTSRRHAAHPIYPYLLRNPGYRTADRGVGDGHHLHSDEPRLRVPRGCARFSHSETRMRAKLPLPLARVVALLVSLCLHACVYAGEPSSAGGNARGDALSDGRAADPQDATLTVSRTPYDVLRNIKLALDSGLLARDDFFDDENLKRVFGGTGVHRMPARGPMQTRETLPSSSLVSSTSPRRREWGH
jgi:hypothetical protein